MSAICAFSPHIAQASDTCKFSTKIDAYSFVGMPDSSLTVPEGVSSIGEGAFAGSAFKTIKLPSTLDSIEAYAFAGCKRLESVDLPASVNHIGRNAFSGCISLRSITFPENITFIGDEAFQSTDLKKADFSVCHSLCYVGAWAFAGCLELSSVIFPATTGILFGEGTFMNCNNLQSITLPNTDNLPAYMFAGCSNADLGATIALSQIKSIGDYALAGNHMTNTVTIPYSLKEVGNHAMERMTSLSHIDARALKSVPLTGEEVWSGVNQSNVTLDVIPDLYLTFATAPQWQEFNIVQTSHIPVTPSDRNSCATIEYDGRTMTAIANDFKIARLNIISMGGVIIDSYAPFSSEFSIDMTRLSHGIYILNILMSNGETESFTFVK